VVVGTDGPGPSLPTGADERDLGSSTGRLPGSVPAEVTRRSACDVPVVHTTG
jgi:hypothetical protein